MSAMFLTGDLGTYLSGEIHCSFLVTSQVYGMDTVDGQPNVLLGWINDEAARLMEKTSEDNVKKGMEKLLDLTFKKFAPTPIKTVLR